MEFWYHSSKQMSAKSNYVVSIQFGINKDYAKTLWGMPRKSCYLRVVFKDCDPEEIKEYKKYIHTHR